MQWKIFYQWFAFKRGPSDENHWWLCLCFGQLWRREFQESALLKLASCRLTGLQQPLIMEMLFIMQTSTSGNITCGFRDKSINMMLSSYNPDITVGHAKECYSWQRVLNIKTERKASKLSIMNNLVAAMFLGWREKNSVALHYCKNQVFQTPAWNFRDQVITFLSEGIAKQNPPSALTEECNMRNQMGENLIHKDTQVHWDYICNWLWRGRLCVNVLEENM